MEELVNDIGELANPHTAHIMISEFKKFLFLNEMNIRQLGKDNKPLNSPMFPDDTTNNLKVFTSLTAPPLVDVVWRMVIRREVAYSKLCDIIFGGFLERAEPIESNKSLYTDYTRTLDLLSTYSNVLNPCNAIWPNIRNDQVEFEYDNTVFLSKKKLHTLRKIAEKDTKDVRFHFLS